MKRHTWAFIVWAVAAGAQARDFHGVRMPDAVTISGKQAKLNGMGLRKKFIFDVYVAGLYVETPSTDPAKLITSDEAKRMTLFMLRDLGKDKIVEALREGFEKNSKEQMPALKDRLDQLAALIPDAKKSSTIVIAYVPGSGTMLSTSGESGGDRRTESHQRQQTSVIPGKDFADALFSVWLGPHPVDDELKKGLVGG